MRVLVTDGDNRAALAIVRSLGRAGHKVVVGEKRAPALAHVSRYCSGRVVYPDPAPAPEDFVRFMAQTVRDQRIEVLMPVADITTMLVTEYRTEFGKSCAIPFAASEVIQRAADKVDVLQTAARLGVPIPSSVVVEGADCVPDVPFGFPVVVKPFRSRVRTSGGWISTAVSFASSREQLVRDVSHRPRHEFPLLLQERIVGPGMGVFACYVHGRPVALFSHRRLRERPPWGGVAVLSESVPLDPFARDCALRLLEELQWNGVAMVEFKRDVRDGLPKLMEINGRFWGSLQLAIDAGVDFPTVLLAGRGVTRTGQPEDYRIGVRSRWLWGDLDSLLVSLIGSGTPVSTPRGRLRALLDFAKFWGRDLHYDNPRVQDLKPWILETYRWFERLAQNASSHADQPNESTGHSGRVTVGRS